MGKRFYDTEIWKKRWYRDLSCLDREALRYVLADCDAVGVWVPDFEIARVVIGEDIDWPALPGKTHNNIRVISDAKWWVVDFCDFQYGPLAENSLSKPIQAYIRMLKKHDLWKDYRRASEGVPEPREGPPKGPLSLDQIKDRGIASALQELGEKLGVEA